MTIVEMISKERDERMVPFAPWFTGEPCITLDYSRVIFDEKRTQVIITLKDIAEALSR